MFPVIAAIPCMLGVATKYCQSEKTIVVAFFYAFSVSSRVVESTAVSS